jgi:hypothetical protein
MICRGGGGRIIIQFVITNGLSEAITEISVAKADAEFADTDKLNMNGNQVEAGASAAMYYTLPKEQGNCKLKVVTASAAEYVITAFPANDIEEFSILSAEDAELGAFAYIEYNSVSTEEEVSTKEDEIAYLTEQKIAAEEAAAAQAAAEEAARQAAEEAARQEAAAQQQASQNTQDCANILG